MRRQQVLPILALVLIAIATFAGATVATVHAFGSGALPKQVRSTPERLDALHLIAMRPRRPRVR